MGQVTEIQQGTSECHFEVVALDMMHYCAAEQSCGFLIAYYPDDGLLKAIASNDIKAMGRLCERKLTDSVKDSITDVRPYELEVHGEDFAD